MRMALLDSHERNKCFIDNDAPGALHYWGADLHTYLTGNAYTLDFRVSTAQKDSALIAEGDKIAFVLDGTSYYCTVVEVDRGMEDIAITCWGLSLELTNEEVDATPGDRMQTIEEYLSALHFESEIIKIGVNQIAGEKRYLAFDKRESILKRMYGLAEKFGAEIGFEVVLKPHYGLDHIRLNIYKAGERIGVGADRTAQIIRYTSGIESIERNTDISKLYTRVRARGKKAQVKEELLTRKRRYVKGGVSNVRQISRFTDQWREDRVNEWLGDFNSPSWKRTTIKVTYYKKNGDTTTETIALDESFETGTRPDNCTGDSSYTDDAKTDMGERERTVNLDGYIRSVSDAYGTYTTAGEDITCNEARDKYPASLARNASGALADGYIVRYFEDGTIDNQADLWRAALKDLQTNSRPKVSYTVTGRIDGAVGDWVMIEDAEYDPPIYLQCRIVEQEIDPLDSSRCRTVFDNFTEYTPKRG